MAEDMVLEEGTSPAQSPLVAVTFQRDVHRKKKFLEAEPKALGITQISLSVYKIICVGVFQAKGLNQPPTDIPVYISSLLVVIAGYVAVAAQNLHLPRLRACLGMQILACGASVVNIVCTVIKMQDIPYSCWYGRNQETSAEVCQQIVNTHTHLYAGGVLIHTALLAISITLAAYCCKVVNCCGPAPKMPVITIQHQQPSREDPDQAGSEE